MLRASFFEIFNTLEKNNSYSTKILTKSNQFRVSCITRKITQPEILMNSILFEYTLQRLYESSLYLIGIILDLVIFTEPNFVLTFQTV